MIKKVLVTGSSGLVGSESVRFFAEKGFIVVGVDNDMRKFFFGNEASTEWNKNKLIEQYRDQYIHYNIDIRDDARLESIFKEHTFDLIIHAAAQPSHDWAAKEPMTDFSINATATLLLLEMYRKYSPQATFIFMSTNKVYGDTPNTLPLIETKTRYEIKEDHPYYCGINETMSIDQSKHSIFGASKVAADIMVQEYGKYFSLNTCVFRGGCLTGSNHSSAQMHGFLAYLVKCVVTGKEYQIFGYNGKQVRDNIHSKDLINMFWQVYQHPRKSEVYNVGGGRSLSISIIEAIQKIEKITHRKAKYIYNPQERSGDHKWYITDVSKFKGHYPSWDVMYSIDMIIEEIFINHTNYAYL